MNRISYGVFEDIGMRDEMENAYSIISIEKKNFFCAEVYDGHGGHLAAKIASTVLTPYFLKLRSIEADKPDWIRLSDLILLRQAYLATDSLIKKKILVAQRLLLSTCLEINFLRQM